MATRSNSSRERILQCAETIILQKGFSATSIDDIIKSASITKGGFFYHFEGKPGLAKALIERYLEQDDIIFNNLLNQADDLSEDPLHQLLIFFKLMAEMLGNMKETHPGCLVASFTYETQLFNDEIREMMLTGIINWRRMIVERLENIMKQYPMQSDVTVQTLADMFSTIVEGGIVLARNFQDNQILIDQILGYRSFVRLVFGAK